MVEQQCSENKMNHTLMSSPNTPADLQANPLPSPVPDFWEEIDEGWDLTEEVGCTIRKAVLQAVETEDKADHKVAEQASQKVSAPVITPSEPSIPKITPDDPIPDKDSSPNESQASPAAKEKIQVSSIELNAVTAEVKLRSKGRSRAKGKKNKAKASSSATSNTSAQAPKKLDKRKTIKAAHTPFPSKKEKKAIPPWLLPFLVFLAVAIMVILALIASAAKSANG